MNAPTGEPTSTTPPVPVYRAAPRRRTYIPYTPTTYEEHMAALDRLRDSQDDDDRAKYGDEVSA